MKSNDWDKYIKALEYYKGTLGNGAKKVSGEAKAIVDEKARALNQLFKKTKPIAKELSGDIAKAGSKAKGGLNLIGKRVLNVGVPFVGVAGNTYGAIKNWKQGNKGLALMNAGEASVDLIFDIALTLEALGALGTEGATAAAIPQTVAAKSAAKIALKKTCQKLVDVYGKHGAKIMLAQLGLNGLASLIQGSKDGNISDSDINAYSESLSNGNSSDANGATEIIQQGNQPIPGYRFDNNSNIVTPTDRQIEQDIQNNLKNLEETTSQDEQSNVEQRPSNQDIEKFYKDYLLEQEYMRPYREGLKSYVDDYRKLQWRDYNNNRVLAGMYGVTGNSYIGNQQDKFNLSDIDAKRLDLMKAYAQEQQNALRGYNRITGNMMVGQQAGLPPEAIWADPAFVQKIASINNARVNAEAKKYYADMNYKRAIDQQRLKGAYDQAIAQGKYDTAKSIANVMYQGKINSAYLQGLPFAQDQSYNDAAARLGIPVSGVKFNQNQGDTAYGNVNR